MWSVLPAMTTLGTLSFFVAMLNRAETASRLPRTEPGAADRGVPEPATSLDLSLNLHNGTLPPALFNATELRILSLASNAFSGVVPTDRGVPEPATSLDLSLNLLNGTLPPVLFNATELRILSLASNAFSGVVPSSLGALPQLQHVNLSANAFFGHLPVELTTAPALRFLSLSGNNFSGEVPVGFGTNSQPLEALDLSSNQLSGSLLSEIGTIRYLNLSSNRLSGPTLPELGRSMPTNATLDLSYNNLSGPVLQTGAFLNQQPQSEIFRGRRPLMAEFIKNGLLLSLRHFQQPFPGRQRAY